MCSLLYIQSIILIAGLFKKKISQTSNQLTQWNECCYSQFYSNLSPIFCKTKGTSTDTRDRTVNLHKWGSDCKTISKRLSVEETTAVTISEWKETINCSQLWDQWSSVEEHRMKTFMVSRQLGWQSLWKQVQGELCVWQWASTDWKKAEENRMWSGETNVSTWLAILRIFGRRTFTRTSPSSVYYEAWGWDLMELESI